MTSPISTVTVATGQFSACADIEANIETMSTLTAEAAAAGAQVVVFPEAAMYKQKPDRSTPSVVELAQELDGPFVSAMAELARKHEVALVTGMATPGGTRAHNMIVVLDQTGAIIATYDKIHLFDAFQGKESDRYIPAPLTDVSSALVTVDLFGMRFGITNCYDLRFPELYRALADLGSQTFLVPAAWVDGPSKALHWDVLLQARAIENTSYVVGAGQSPPTGTGFSTIVDPFGARLATATEAEGIAIARLDPARIDHCRKLLPSLANRRLGVHSLI